MKQMIFWGATGQAKVLRECMQGSGLELVALFDNDAQVRSPFANVPIYYGVRGFDEWLKTRASSDPLGFLVAIGGDKGRDRVAIQEYLAASGCTALRAIHPSAVISASVTIGAGSQILANATISVEADIASACIINTGAIVDHECRIAAGVHIGTGAKLAGCVEVEPYATVYTGAVVLPRIRIGPGAIVGAGAVVVEDVPAYTVVAGNPARVIKKAAKTK
ncbi:MAG: NeuD/PglB/VioB family sugar acetyltransferase [Desulfobacterales bacterium]|nr:MAG: NeuD/PglB/VioB family sugar acetyltransferase [Desulfobacterales bacterium]